MRDVRKHNPVGPRGAGVRRVRRMVAFTLLELLVAIGASVLIALALAQLFKTTGETVTKGRRAAYFNSYAAMIQRTLSQDFAQMTRSGYMVIRHEVTNNGNTNPGQTAVGLFRGQAAALARPRRIDEIMFFDEGSFASAREAVHPDLVARSGQARIYIGHGTVSQNFTSAGDPYQYAKFAVFGNPNTLAGRLGQPAIPGQPGLGPNAFASDWILLRHVTLLTLPQANIRDFPLTAPFWGINPNPATGPGRIRLENKDRQIAGQPAASSLFRTLNVGPAPLNNAAYPAQGGWIRPPVLTFASGLVDIATTDLAEIRSYVMQTHNGNPGAEQPLFPWNNPGGGSPFGLTLPVPQSYAPRTPLAFGASPDPRQQSLVYNMHAWMRNGMPTNSQADPVSSGVAPAQAPRTRIRCADSARNLPAILADASLAATGKQMQRSDLLSNERMLTASNFVPHCSEFVVEWSFGEVNPFTGQTRWYGTSVPNDQNNDGVPESIGFTRYDFDDSNDPPKVRLFLDRTTGEFTTDQSQHPIDPHLIYGASFDAPAAPSPQPLVAHFGFTDPTYVNANEQQLPTLAWPWPKMVRFTITLTDPSDATIERSFQFVFQTPEAGRN